MTVRHLRRLSRQKWLCAVADVPTVTPTWCCGLDEPLRSLFHAQGIVRSIDKPLQTSISYYLKSPQQRKIPDADLNILVTNCGTRGFGRHKGLRKLKG
jgi:hypothetical protein